MIARRSPSNRTGVVAVRTLQRSSVVDAQTSTMFWAIDGMTGYSSVLALTG